MTRPRERIATVAAYVEFVLGKVEAWRKETTTSPLTVPEGRPEFWFRGHSRSSHTLVPSAYRTKQDHLSMFNRFVAAGAGVLSPAPSTTWDWYFAAQHYELPTRLLDWTEDPLAAAFFAVRGMLPDHAPLSIDAEDPPVVWMMDAASLNLLTYGAYEVAVPFDDGQFTKYWSPGVVSADPTAFTFANVGYTNERPIAIWPTRTTPRIMAQNGCFTVHGTARDPVDYAFDASTGEHSLRLVAIELPDANRIDQELFDLGITRLRLFPELHNVASRLRRLYSA